MGKKVEPLSNVLPVYGEYDYGGYPEMIRIAMSDGKIVNYRIVIDQPHPAVQRSIDLIRIMKDHTYGGSYKGKHAKKE